MPLDPKAQAILDAGAGQPTLWSLPVPDGRIACHSIIELGGDPEPMHSVIDTNIPGPGGDIPIRIFRPTADPVLPAMLYFHGGGWVLCGLETHDKVCRSLARRAGCAIIAVDYRLAPEHKFPAAVEDAYAATAWVAANAREIGVDPDRIAVGGDSAGGNLSTVICLIARDRGTPRLVFQLLVYPVTDYYLPGTPSYTEFADGYSLTRDFMIWFFNHYLPERADVKHPHLSPLHVKDLSGLPPALVITAEYDPLRDEGEMYAERLKQAGVPTKLTRYNGVFHPFYNMAGELEQARQALDESAAALREAFALRLGQTQA